MADDSTPKRIIHGPGASDFVTAQGGIDFPESGIDKGTGQLRDEDVLTNESRVTPELEVEEQSSDDKPTL
jgi:hypothetical protein